MARRFEHIQEVHRTFMERQRIFFVASAAPDGHVNVSPRSTDAFRYIDARTVIYLDRTGSGNETAAHIRAGGRMTIMFCAVDGPPLILRLYGTGRVHGRRERGFSDLLAAHFGGQAPLGTRQIVSLDVELTQSSCGYGVPLFAYSGERSIMEDWAAAKGQAGIEDYWREKNLTSLDDLPTGLQI